MRKVDIEAINAYIAYFKISTKEVVHYLQEYADMKSRILGWYRYHYKKENKK